MFRNIIFIALCVISTTALSASPIQGDSPEKVQPPAKVKPEWIPKEIQHIQKKIYPDRCPIDGCPPAKGYPDRCPAEGCLKVDYCPPEGCPPK